jgi:hypothetical protein
MTTAKMSFMAMILSNNLFFMLRREDFELSSELKITGLKILRKIIEMENSELLTPAADWGTEDWEDCVPQVEAKQNFLVEKG